MREAEQKIYIFDVEKKKSLFTLKFIYIPIQKISTTLFSLAQYSKTLEKVPALCHNKVALETFK